MGSVYAAKTLRQKKAGAPEWPFRVVFIWMSGPARDPMVGVLRVGTYGSQACIRRDETLVEMQALDWIPSEILSSLKMN